MSPAIEAMSSSAVRRTSANAACSSARRRRPRPNERNARKPTPATIAMSSHGTPPPPLPPPEAPASGGPWTPGCAVRRTKSSRTAPTPSERWAANAARDSAIAVLIGSAFEATRKLLPVTTA